MGGRTSTPDSLSGAAAPNQVRGSKPRDPGAAGQPSRADTRPWVQPGTRPRDFPVIQRSPESPEDGQTADSWPAWPAERPAPCHSRWPEVPCQPLAQHPVSFTSPGSLPPPARTRAPATVGTVGVSGPDLARGGEGRCYRRAKVLREPREAGVPYYESTLQDSEGLEAKGEPTPDPVSGTLRSPPYPGPRRLPPPARAPGRPRTCLRPHSPLGTDWDTNLVYTFAGGPSPGPVASHAATRAPVGTPDRSPGQHEEGPVRCPPPRKQPGEGLGAGVYPPAAAKALGKPGPVALISNQTGHRAKRHLGGKPGQAQHGLHLAAQAVSRAPGPTASETTHEPQWPRGYTGPAGAPTPSRTRATSAKRHERGRGSSPPPPSTPGVSHPCQVAPSRGPTKSCKRLPSPTLPGDMSGPRLTRDPLQPERPATGRHRDAGPAWARLCAGPQYPGAGPRDLGPNVISRGPWALVEVRLDRIGVLGLVGVQREAFPRPLPRPAAGVTHRDPAFRVQKLPPPRASPQRREAQDRASHRGPAGARPASSPGPWEQRLCPATGTATCSLRTHFGSHSAGPRRDDPNGSAEGPGAPSRPEQRPGGGSGLLALRVGSSRCPPPPVSRRGWHVAAATRQRPAERSACPQKAGHAGGPGSPTGSCRQSRLAAAMTSTPRTAVGGATQAPAECQLCAPQAVSASLPQSRTQCWGPGALWGAGDRPGTGPPPPGRTFTPAPPAAPPSSGSQSNSPAQGCWHRPLQLQREQGTPGGARRQTRAAGPRGRVAVRCPQTPRLGPSGPRGCAPPTDEGSRARGPRGCAPPADPAARAVRAVWLCAARRPRDSGHPAASRTAQPHSLHPARPDQMDTQGGAGRGGAGQSGDAIAPSLSRARTASVKMGAGHLRPPPVTLRPPLGAGMGTKLVTLPRTT
ncbi:collagen alpha-1(I) chain-like [Dipodomys merriami]|uniref:collagen alpha-1(I) chain-like n=1 Tax=Dipodomys merriami TaxID=94247 RepID=UPI003855A9E7